MTTGQAPRKREPTQADLARREKIQNPTVREPTPPSERRNRDLSGRDTLPLRKTEPRK